MKHRTRYSAIVWVWLCPVLAFSQVQEQKKSVFAAGNSWTKPSGILNALLDPSKFSMSQSYSLSFLASGSRSYNQGLYLNQMTYRFSNPLIMQVAVGYMHQPFGGPILAKNAGGNLFVQRASLQYRPSQNTIFSIQYESLPYGMHNPYSTRTGIGW